MDESEIEEGSNEYADVTLREINGTISLAHLLCYYMKGRLHHHERRRIHQEGNYA